MDSTSAGAEAAACSSWNHCCCLHVMEPDRRAGIAPFLAEGLQQGERLLYVVDSDDAQATLDWLKASGLDAEGLVRSGQLQVATADEAFLHSRRFDPDRAIAWLGEAAEGARTDAASGLRVTMEMAWALRGLPGCGRLLEFESMLEGFLQRARCKGLCQYDVRRFEALLLFAVLPRHQAAILGSQTYLNADAAFAAYRAELALAGTARSDLPFRADSQAVPPQGQAAATPHREDRGCGLRRTDTVVNTEGVITHVSGDVEPMLGYAREEMAGKRIMDLLQPVDEAERAVLQRVFERPDSSHTVEARVRRKDGAWCVGEVTFTNLLHLPPLSGIVVNIRDTTELVRLERGILQGHISEHQHLRHDIHDGLAGYFTALAFRTKVLQRKLAAGAVVHAEELDEILQLVGGARAATRALSKGLSPVGDGPDGLMSALKELTSRKDAFLGVPVRFHCAQDVPVGDLFSATQAYRIVQEAVNNALRHGKPTEVSITMSAARGLITLAVHDDGVGIPDGAAEGPGMGLRTMQYRARLMGGSLSVARRPNGGTLVTLTFQNPSAGG